MASKNLNWKCCDKFDSFKWLVWGNFSTPQLVIHFPYLFLSFQVGSMNWLINVLLKRTFEIIQNHSESIAMIQKFPNFILKKVLYFGEFLSTFFGSLFFFKKLAWLLSFYKFKFSANLLKDFKIELLVLCSYFEKIK